MAEKWALVGTILGASVAGVPGAWVGRLIGIALDSSAPGISDVVANILGNLGTDGVKYIYAKGRQQLLGVNANQVNHDLQVAFRDALCDAICDIGGRECFPQQWRQKRREVPETVIFRVASLRTRDAALADQVCQWARTFHASIDELFPLTTDETDPRAVDAYLTSQEVPTRQFWEDVIDPFLLRSKLPIDEVPDFISHLG